MKNLATCLFAIAFCSIFLADGWGKGMPNIDTSAEIDRVNRPMMARGRFKRKCNRNPASLIGTNVRDLCSEIYDRIEEQNSLIDNYIGIYGIDKESNPRIAVIFHGKKSSGSYEFRKIEVINEDGLLIEEMPIAIFNKTLYGQKYDPFRFDGDADPDPKLESCHVKIRKDMDQGFIQFCFDDNPNVGGTKYNCYKTIAIKEGEEHSEP